MNQGEPAGFWRQWDVQVLNYQIVAVLNILAGLFLGALWQSFDLNKLVDLANWSIFDFYIFLGPLIAQAVSLLLVDSVTWLVGYDFGVSNEMVIYWGLMVVNTFVQVAGNGTSVALIGIYAFIGLVVLGVSAVIPAVAISNPITLILFVLFAITVLAPILVDIAGFFLFGSFLVLTVALFFDAFYLLFTSPDVAVNTLADVFENGLASPYVQDWEDTVEQFFGTGFGALFGTSLMRDILDNFGLHFGLQVGIVFPLAIALTLGKMLAIAGGMLMLIIGIISALSGPGKDYEILFIYGGIVVVGYFVIFDGALGGLVDHNILSQLYPTEDLTPVLIGDIFARSFLHSVLSLEADYWGIYFLVRLVKQWTLPDSQWLHDEYKLPKVGQADFQTTLGDLASYFTPDNLERADFKLLETFTKPMIITVFMPLIQVLTWAYQYPFFMEMSYHIRGVPPDLE